MFIFAVYILTGCSSSQRVQSGDEKNTKTNTYVNVSHVPEASAYYDLPSDFRDEKEMLNTIEYYSQYLTGRKIFLDPGHGGEDRSNRSRSGKIVEADINLHVAKHLKKYLEMAGAVVIMSRETDETVELQERAEMFNRSDAEIFISIHHNAAARSGDFWTNYTSTFYHARPNVYEYEPSSHDLALYIQRDLSYAVGNSGGLGSFDGTYSDYRSFPGKGFYVLREIKRPGVLVECAFHTNRFEEKRLIDKQYNALEAWGIFRGLGRYYANGIPEVKLLTEESDFNGADLKLVFQIKDENGIDFSRTEVFFDKEVISFETDESESEIIIHVKDVAEGEHEVRVICLNTNNIHNRPHNVKIRIR